mgnify:FL=1
MPALRGPVTTGYDELVTAAGTIQRKRGTGPAALDPAQSGSMPTTGGGQRLPEAVRTRMERAYGFDFSAVRVHESKKATALGARAYTEGTNIHFAPRQYDPTSQAGQTLLGHELAHVVQQSQGRVKATTQASGNGVNDDASLEREADAMGAMAVQGQRVAGRATITAETAGHKARPQAALQRKPTTSQAGTVAQFIEVLNNTPSGMGRTTGPQASEAMLRLGETEMSWTGPLPKTTPYFNTRPARYIYTTKGGWLDMVHFLFHAGRAYKYLQQKIEATRMLEEIQAKPWYQRMLISTDFQAHLYKQSTMSPAGESVQEGYQTERMQKLMTPRSAYSYEDLPSDAFGARFAVEYFDPNARSTFGEQLAAYLIQELGAVDPQSAPNYSDLPAEDDGNVGRQNFTTTPVYTKANP